MLFSVFLFPWLMDVLSGQWILMTVFGATLWGLAIIVAIVRLETRDPKILRSLHQALVLLASVFCVYWGACYLFFPLEFTGPEGMPSHGLIRVFTISHAVFLSAGAAVLLFYWWISVLLMEKFSQLKKSSWERRHKNTWMPSLETLKRFRKRALIVAFSAWSIGLVQAFVSAMARWRYVHLHVKMSLVWLLDFKVLSTVLLWFVLLWLTRLRAHTVASEKSQRFALVLSSAFIVYFLVMIIFGNSDFHLPVRWFYTR